MTATERKVISIVSERLGVSESNVTADTAFKDLGVDSLDFVELVMAFEDYFDITIPDADGEALKTVREAVECIDKRSNLG